MQRYALLNGASEPRTEKPYLSFLAHLSITLPHGFMCRVDDVIEVRLADLQLDKGSDDGCDGFPKLVITSTMKHSNGQPGFLFAIPHVDPFACVFVAIGWMLFAYVSPSSFFSWRAFILRCLKCDVTFTCCAPILCLCPLCVCSIFVLLGCEEPDWADDAEWKELRLWPGRTPPAKRGRVGAVNPKIPAKYDAVRSSWIQLLAHAGAQNGAIRVSKVASMARRSAAQHTMDAMSAQAGQFGACITLPVQARA